MEFSEASRRILHKVIIRMTSDVGEVGYRIRMEPTGDRYAHSITTPSTIQLYSPKEIAHAVARQLQRRASVPKVEELGRAVDNIYVIKIHRPTYASYRCDPLQKPCRAPDEAVAIE